MSNGAQTYVGYFGIDDGLIVAITFDGEGNLYGIDLVTDSLYSINTSTGAATLIGPLGINLNYAQDAAYDIDNGILYLSAYVVSPVSGGYLCTCDVATGTCTQSYLLVVSLVTNHRMYRTG